MEHYKEKLSSYLHHELPREERQMIAEHLLQCEFCREEHDQIKLGVSLASKLETYDAPVTVWNEIQATLDGKTVPSLFIDQNSIFDSRRWFSLAAGSLIVAGFFITLYYVNLFYRPRIETANLSQHSNPLKSTQNSTEGNSASNQASQFFSGSGWEVETIAGTHLKNRLKVGETLQTDAGSRARITVADIGNVEVESNSRVKLVASEQSERRLSLEHGSLKATIYAPPRLFIVDTPSAVAVDLGCAYNLEVDKAGNSKLQVTSGFVALERDGRESIVPAGATALTKKGKGIGTPYFDDVSLQFIKALYKFDFENGGRRALRIVLEESRSKDALTLWHLLSRTNGAERVQVFEKLNELVKLPVSTTKEGILSLDKKMLETWQREIGILWY